MVVFCPGSLELVSVSCPFGVSLSKLGRVPAVRAELVEALVCWLEKHAWVQGGSRESPGVRVTFFCFAKRKSPKKRRPPVCDPCASLRGKPASCRLRGAPWNSLRCDAASFRHPRRVSSRSTRAPTRVPPHNRPAAGASSRGEEPNIQQPNSHTGHRCARPSFRSAWRLRPRDGAERSAAKQWPVWMSVFGSLLRAPRSAGQGVRACAEGHTHFVH